MADFKLGDLDISSAYVGSDEVIGMYYGSTKVWPSEAAIEYLTMEGYDRLHVVVDGSVDVDVGTGTFTTYTSGAYDLFVSGTVRVDISSLTTGLEFSPYGYQTGVTEIIQWGNQITSNLAFLKFEDNTLLDTIPNSWSPLLALTTTESMFVGCSSLSDIPDSWAGLDNVTSMTEMFANTYVLNLPDSWAGLEKVTSISATFYGTRITTLPDSWGPLGDAYYVNRAFGNCTWLATIPDDWYGLDSATVANGMFRNCTSLTSIPADWRGLDSVVDAGYMFEGSGITRIPSSWNDLDSLENAEYMFSDTNISSAGTQQLWALSNVTECKYMFSDCTSLDSNMEDIYLQLETTATSYEGWIDGSDNVLDRNIIPIDWGGDAGSGSLDLAVYTTDLKTQANIMYQAVMVTNNSTTTLLSGWKVRYWFTLDYNTIEALSTWGVPSGWSSSVVTGGETPNLKAIRYIEYTASSTLSPGGSTNSNASSWGGQMNQSSWSDWDKTDDPSYNGQFGTTYAINTNMTVYDSTGTLVYGTEPS